MTSAIMREEAQRRRGWGRGRGGSHEMPGAPGSRGRQADGPLEPWDAMWPCCYFDFESLASSIGSRRKKIRSCFCCFTPPAHGDPSGTPWDRNKDGPEGGRMITVDPDQDRLRLQTRQWLRELAGEAGVGGHRCGCGRRHRQTESRSTKDRSQPGLTVGRHCRCQGHSLPAKRSVAELSSFSGKS